MVSLSLFSASSANYHWRFYASLFYCLHSICQSEIERVIPISIRCRLPASRVTFSLPCLPFLPFPVLSLFCLLLQPNLERGLVSSPPFRFLFTILQSNKQNNCVFYGLFLFCLWKFPFIHISRQLIYCFEFHLHSPISARLPVTVTHSSLSNIILSNLKLVCHFRQPICLILPFPSQLSCRPLLFPSICPAPCTALLHFHTVFQRIFAFVFLKASLFDTNK